MTTLADAPPPNVRRVRVWFGEHVIADYTAEPAAAMRYQAGMTRRFASLRITIEPATRPPDELAESARSRPQLLTCGGSLHNH